MYAITFDEEYLMHHGKKGQKWGIQNGPPYPLDYDKIAKRAVKEGRDAGEEISKAKTDAIRRGDLEEVNKNKDYFTDQEVRDVMTRFNLNQTLSALDAESRKEPDKFNATMDKVESFVDKAYRVGNVVDKGTKTWDSFAKVANSLGMEPKMPVIQDQQWVQNFNRAKQEAEKARLQTSLADKQDVEAKKAIHDYNKQRLAEKQAAYYETPQGKKQAYKEARKEARMRYKEQKKEEKWIAKQEAKEAAKAAKKQTKQEAKEASKAAKEQAKQEAKESAQAAKEQVKQDRKEQKALQNRVKEENKHIAQMQREDFERRQRESQERTDAANNRLNQLREETARNQRAEDERYARLLEYNRSQIRQGEQAVRRLSGYNEAVNSVIAENDRNTREFLRRNGYI